MFLKILVLPTAMSYLCWQKLRETMRQTDALGKDWLEGGRFDGWLVPFSCREVAHYPSFLSFYTPGAVVVNMKHSDLLSNVAKCNLGKVNLELMLRAVWPVCTWSVGAPLGVRRGNPHTALLSSDRCDQCFCEQIFADSLAFISRSACNFFPLCLVQLKNNQATPLIKVESMSLPCVT